MSVNNIILIGPMGVGKSSAAKALANITGLEYIDVDEMRWDYFSSQPDFNGEMVDKLFDDSKETEAFSYMKPFEARFVVHILGKYPCGIFDFGAGYTVYEDEKLFDMVKSALSNYDYVLFLRYSTDSKESIAALYRHTDIPKELYSALNKGFIESSCNDLLATHTVDTKGKTIDGVVNSILDIIQCTQ